MRWPDLFFKRKSKPVPVIATVPPKSAALSEKTEEEREEASRVDKEKTESLRALADIGASTTTPRVVKESLLASPVEKSPDGFDSGNAKTAALPAVTPRVGGVSLRQRAKLTDDALAPKKETLSFSSPEPDKPKPVEETETRPLPEAKSDTPAIVPAAFPISIETGTVLENEKATAMEAAVAQEVKPPAEKVTSEPSPPRTDSSESAPRDTVRVNIAHTTTGDGKPSTALEPVKADHREKSEFILANGERILGHILSETPQTIYLDHGTLGVLTLPRSQIATKPIEVILINGDRIVGDLIAETPECLYIKHASLGMLTVPHGQRSTRVVEAILKDGDRILGEVLAETENFTVIRSATLGTVAVQHEQVAMLNRKIEQMQLRSLPSSGAPALEDKRD